MLEYNYIDLDLDRALGALLNASHLCSSQSAYHQEPISKHIEVEVHQQAQIHFQEVLVVDSQSLQVEPAADHPMKNVQTRFDW